MSHVPASSQLFSSVRPVGLLLVSLPDDSPQHDGTDFKTNHSCEPYAGCFGFGAPGRDRRPRICRRGYSSCCRFMSQYTTPTIVLHLRLSPLCHLMGLRKQVQRGNERDQLFTPRRAMQRPLPLDAAADRGGGDHCDTSPPQHDATWWFHVPIRRLHDPSRRLHDAAGPRLRGVPVDQRLPPWLHVAPGRRLRVTPRKRLHVPSWLPRLSPAGGAA